MNVSNVKKWTPAMLTRGKYHLKITKADEFTGKNADDNGEVSSGVKLYFKVMGPAENLLTNGESCVGFDFQELLTQPRASTSPKGVEMMNARIKDRLVSCFGEDFSDDVDPADWVGKEIMASIKVEYDDYSKGDVPKIQYTKPLGAE